MEISKREDSTIRAFANSPGQVAVLLDRSTDASIAILNMPDTPVSASSTRAIVTSVQLNQEVNLQFLHTLGRQVFVYVFGDRVGEMSLGGVCFERICDFGSESALSLEGKSPRGQHGGEDMLLWYSRNKASARASPVRVMLGNTPIEGYIRSFTFSAADAETRLMQWSAKLATLPPR